MEGTITKNETIIMITGEKYKFSVIPTDIVTINNVTSKINHYFHNNNNQ